MKGSSPAWKRVPMLVFLMALVVVSVHPFAAALRLRPSNEPPPRLPRPPWGILLWNEAASGPET